jgi:hypothetical protein
MHQPCHFATAVALLRCAEPGKHFRQGLWTDIEVLADAPPEHCCWYVSIAAFLLGLMENVQDHALLARETVSSVGDDVADIGNMGKIGYVGGYVAGIPLAVLRNLHLVRGLAQCYRRR